MVALPPSRRARQVADERRSPDERVIEHTVGPDSGAHTREGIKSVAKKGGCPETAWTYDRTDADQGTGIWPPGAEPAKKLFAKAHSDARKHKVVSYERVPRSVTQLQGCLAAGYPVGYDDKQRRFIVRN